jgi:3-dehydroquinate dehydratase-2
VEVHISDIQAREDFRKISVIEDVCIAQISGLGKQGYVDAIQLLTDL